MNLLAGVPPLGRGIFARNLVIGAPFRWHAVTASRAGVRDQIAALRAAGSAEQWLFEGPDSWRPETWRATLTRIQAQHAALGTAGIIVDAENGWESLSQSSRRAALTTLGAAMREMSSDVRVMFTSYPSFPDLATLAAAGGDLVIGAPQIYGRTSATDTAEEKAAIGSRWNRLFNHRLVVCNAAWQSSPALSTESGYRDYLRTLPPACASAAWPAGDVPAYMLRALEYWHPGGSRANTLALYARTLATPQIVAALAVLVFAVLVVGKVA